MLIDVPKVGTLNSPAEVVNYQGYCSQFRQDNQMLVEKAGAGAKTDQ